MLPLTPVTWMEVTVGPVLFVAVAPPLPPQAVSAKRIQIVRQTAAFLILPPSNARLRSSSKQRGLQCLPANNSPIRHLRIYIRSGTYCRARVLHIEGTIFGTRPHAWFWPAWPRISSRPGNVLLSCFHAWLPELSQTSAVLACTCRWTARLLRTVGRDGLGGHCAPPAD